MKAHPGKERGESDASSGGPLLGLALGGGALLGLAHIGVLEVLEGAGIRPRVVTGTSVGALIGACYAGGMSLPDMKATARSFSWRRVRKPKMLPTMAVFSTAPMRQFLEETLPAGDFDELEIPLAVVATDLRTAQMVVLGGGYLDGLESEDDETVCLKLDLAEAVRASCTMPVLFEPVEAAGRILVDGFLTSNVPAGLARKMGAEVVLAVDLQQRRSLYENPSNIVEYTIQAQMIYRYWAVKNRQIWADVVVRPELKSFEWDDTARADAIMAAGREAALEKLPELEAALKDYERPGRSGRPERPAEHAGGHRRVDYGG